ncbi:hypothetical protein RhiJN_16143 [Ceratobasidium sp. AG-Ba]|nr:hypothetical protein RhiJN_16143 [Ceratobasidium sp. AG-Ba]
MSSTSGIMDLGVDDLNPSTFVLTLPNITQPPSPASSTWDVRTPSGPDYSLQLSKEMLLDFIAPLLDLVSIANLAQVCQRMRCIFKSKHARRVWGDAIANAGLSACVRKLQTNDQRRRRFLVGLMLSRWKADEELEAQALSPHIPTVLVNKPVSDTSAVVFSTPALMPLVATFPRALILPTLLRSRTKPKLRLNTTRDNLESCACPPAPMLRANMSVGAVLDRSPAPTPASLVVAVPELSVSLPRHLRRQPQANLFLKHKATPAPLARTPSPRLPVRTGPQGPVALGRVPAGRAPSGLLYTWDRWGLAPISPGTVSPGTYVFIRDLELDCASARLGLSRLPGVKKLAPTWLCQI